MVFRNEFVRTLLDLPLYSEPEVQHNAVNASAKCILWCFCDAWISTAGKLTCAVLCYVIGTTTVSPPGSSLWSPAPRGWQTREWTRSRPCTTQKFLQKLFKTSNLIRFHVSVTESLVRQRWRAEARTSSAPAEQQVRCHRHPEGREHVGECREAPCETLDANREDLKTFKVGTVNFRVLTLVSSRGVQILAPNYGYVTPSF